MAASYLGEITWDAVCAALSRDASRLPKTVADLPAVL
jgi:hypothetical protein